jgi:ADP-ribose pyrophosphatase
VDNQSQQDRYNALRQQWPELFDNPVDFPFTILFEPSQVTAAEDAQRARLAALGQPESWACTGVVYEDPYLIVARDAVRFPGGFLGTYVRAIPATGAVGAAVLPVLDDQVVLLDHARHATRTSHLEIPRGFGEPGVAAADQARQELREEIGADAVNLTDLGPFHANTGMSSDVTQLFVAEIRAFGKPQAEEGITDVRLYPARRADQDRSDHRRLHHRGFHPSVATRPVAGSALRRAIGGNHGPFGRNQLREPEREGQRRTA